MVTDQQITITVPAQMTPDQARDMAARSAALDYLVSVLNQSGDGAGIPQKLEAARLILEATKP